MKSSDKAIILGVAMAIFLGGFYLKVLSPKREEASKLGDEIAKLETSIDQQEQVIAVGEDARKNFPKYYGHLVVLGKAVPEGADTASLMVSLNGISSKSDVEFTGITLSDTAGADTAAATPTTPPPTSGTSTTPSTPTSTTPATGSAGTTTPTTAPAPATESAAANLPIGATVGSAGLPVMPYSLTFTGTYFDVANFLSGIDSFVHTGNGQNVSIDGRLLTVDGFSLHTPDSPTSPKLQVDMVLTTYVTPSEQGLTAGASPSAPAPVPGVEAQPTSATVAP